DVDRCSPIEWVSDSSLTCSLPKGVVNDTHSIVVRRSALESAPFYFTATEPDEMQPRTAVDIISQGSSVQLVSVDAVDGSVHVQSAFRLGMVDYGLTGFDAVLNIFHLVTPSGDGGFVLTSISVVAAADGSHNTSSRAVSFEGGAGRKLLAQENSLLMNIEYDQPRFNLVGILSHTEHAECAQSELMIVNTLNGNTTVRPIANASMALNVRALDSAASSFFAIMQGDHQRLVVLSTDANRAPSECESAGGTCQAMHGGAEECAHVAPADNEEDVGKADSICANLGTACDYAQWEPSVGMYVMRTRLSVAHSTCHDAQVVYGPKMNGVRAMTFDMRRAKLLLIIEDVHGVHRSSPGDNFLVVEMDSRSFAPLPGPSMLERVQSRRLLAAQPTFWERDGFWVSEGVAADAVQLAMPAARKVLAFSARRVLPAITLLLHQRGLLLLQEETDSIRVFHYKPDRGADAMGVSEATHITEAPPLLDPQLRDLRALVPVQDLQVLAAPRVVYLRPEAVSAQG
ncbi:MAG: hypothetical protein ACPIOQ_25880, partial [Promethearchaeia archaeon]